MSTVHQLKMLKSLSIIRSGWIEHLSIGHSLIPYDILIEVINAELADKKISVKEVFANLQYSDMGVRYHIRKLTSQGLIITTISAGDKRVKNIHATPKLITQFELLGDALNTVLSLGKHDIADS